MKILIHVILFTLQLSHAWTTNGDYTPLSNFNNGKSNENAPDNIFNYPGEGRDISPVVLFILYSPVLAIVVMPVIATIIIIMVGVGLINKLIPHMVSSVCSPSNKRNIPGRCFSSQLLEIGETLINQDKIDALTRFIDESIQEVKKLYY